MNSRIKILTIYIFFILFLLVNDAFAGKDSKKGTAGALELLIPIGAKGVALSGSSVAYADGIESLNWNPAGLAKTGNTIELFFAHNSHIADIAVNYAAISIQLNNTGNIALSLKNLDLGDIEETTEDFPEGTGNFFSPVLLNIGISYSKIITDRLTAGLTAKYIYEKVYKTRAIGLAFDAGIQYVAGKTGLMFGIVIKNIGSDLKFEGKDLEREIQLTSDYPISRTVLLKSSPFSLPSSLELGFAYKKEIMQFNNLIFSGSFENNNFGNDSYKTGIEYSYDNLLFLRFGYVYVSEEPNYLYQFSYGAGVKYEMSGIGIQLDYAYRPARYFSSNSILNLQLNF